MKRSGALIVTATAAAFLALPVAAQMMHDSDGMGGGRRTGINLVSPTNSLTQVRRGMLMIGQHMYSSRGMMPAPSLPRDEGGQPRVWLLLRLSGVSDPDGLISRTGNQLVFAGRLSSGSGAEEPLTIDQEFTLTNGAALVQVPVTLPTATDWSRVLIDQVAVLDADGNTFAVPGVVIAQPAPLATPQPTPRAACTDNGDCDDHNPNTRDVCMPVGCVHMPGHMGPGDPMM